MTMNNYSVYLFDLDGTVYAGNRPIQTTIDYINYLTTQNKSVWMVTNNATVTATQVKNKLASMGVNTETIAVASSAMATAYTLQKQAVKYAYIVGEPALHEICQDVGIFHDETNAQAVLIGLNRDATYQELAKASELLQKSDMPFVATNYDWRLAQADYFLPGAGTLVSMVEKASARKAEIIGKPHKPMSDYLLSIIKQPKETWVMIGDNYDTDILFGMQNNIDTCFIETGVHDVAHIQKQKLQPTYILKDLGQIAR